MRFTAYALTVSAILFAGCAGGDPQLADTAGIAMDTAAAPVTTTPMPGTPAASGSMAPVTGTWHEVRMVGDAQGYRYEPANLTVRQGDGIRFLMVSGGPHNVAFDPATTPAGVRPQLNANIAGDKMGDLSSAMKMNPGETIEVSFGNIPAGNYPYHCVPHLAMGMTGQITVQ